MKTYTPKAWLVPVCKEAIELLNYYSPHNLYLLDIMYEDPETKLPTTMYKWIGMVENGQLMPYAIRPPMCEMLTIQEFKDKIYLPFCYSFDIL